MNLRTARPDDAEKLANIHMIARETAMPWLPKLHPLEETIWWITNIVLPEQQVWVAEIEGEVCGFMSVLGDMLEQLYILPAYQGQGIGRALLGKAIEIADAPMRLWVFQRNEPARKFYEDRGFAPILFTDGAENEEKTPDVLYRFRDHNQVSPE